MSFIATYAERAGSVHDARVFRVCDVGQKAARNELFPSTEFHLLGDSAYALMMQVIQRQWSSNCRPEEVQCTTQCHSICHWACIRTSKGQVPSSERPRCNQNWVRTDVHRVSLHIAQRHSAARGKWRGGWSYRQCRRGPWRMVRRRIGSQDHGLSSSMQFGWKKPCKAETRRNYEQLAVMNNSDVKVFLVLCVIKNAIRIKSKCYLISN